MTKKEYKELTGEDPEDMFGGDWENEVEGLTEQKITEKEFDKYVEVQESGVTNMFDVRKVEELTGLTKDKILYIMQNYTYLKKR